MTDQAVGNERFESDLEYLEAEFEWAVARAARLKAEHDEIPADEPSPFRRRELKAGIRQEAAKPRERRPKPAEIKALREAEQQVRTRVDRRLAATRDANMPLALDLLCERHHLDAEARIVIILATCLCTSRRLQEAGGARWFDLCVDDVFFFLEMPFQERIRRRSMFGARAPLVGSGLVKLDVPDRLVDPKDLLSASITLPMRTFKFLVGDQCLDDDFMEFSSLEDPRATFDDVVLDPGDLARITRILGAHDRYLEVRREWGFEERIRYGRSLGMLFYGPPGTGKTLTAHAIAARLGKRVLRVDVLAFMTMTHEADHLLPRIFREAALQDALVLFDECELLFKDRRDGNGLMNLMLEELERYEGIVVLATNLPEMLDPALKRRMQVRVCFPEPDSQARQAIWRRLLPEQAHLAADVDLQALASRYELAGGYIKNAVLEALALAVHDDPAAPVLHQRHLEAAAKAQATGLDWVDFCLVQPKVKLDKVVMADETRRDIVELIHAVRYRREVIERWGIGADLGSHKGLAVLFTGGPGTGKTLTAEAIAAELGRGLLLTSMSVVLSKFVGDTEKHLESLFERAQAEGAVLFVDEADSLLAERGSGRASRHDDSAVNVLLTQMEHFDGLLILATNRPEVLDHALGRRLAYSVRFPFPDAAARSRIWAHHFPDTVPFEGAIDFAALGEAYQLSGGQIRQAAFRAATRAQMAAGRITAGLLAEAAAEEARRDRNGKGAVGFRPPGLVANGATETGNVELDRYHDGQTLA
ncbi:MAG: AAA family ATPase [Candidatus Sericytochromatia bacterium]|nr:AAA family ATPase [Candidatus Tanganyikabacteria bacterium]